MHLVGFFIWIILWCREPWTSSLHKTQFSPQSSVIDNFVWRHGSATHSFYLLVINSIISFQLAYRLKISACLIISTFEVKMSNTPLYFGFSEDTICRPIFYNNSINHLNTNINLHYMQEFSSYRAVNTLPVGYKNT